MIWPDFVPQWYVWIIGIFLPFAENYIIQSNWKTIFKSLAAFTIAVLVSLGATYIGGQFDVGHILSTLAVVFGLAQITYDSFWKTKLP